MLDSKTKDLCRVCARELYGNQRRWIFNPTAKLSLQVLLSHAVGRQLTRDGRREFACSKCAFMLDRMYRFDTVIARVEALSIERMQKLLLEKERLRQCIGGLYRKNNPEEIESETSKSTAEASLVDTPAPSDTKYSSLLEEDLTYSVYECWAEHGTGPHQQAAHQHHHHQCHQCHAGSEASTAHRSRKCRGCTTLRVADSDYEAICKVPRKVGRSTSCGPSTRYSVSNLTSTEETCPESEAQEQAAQSSSLTEISQTLETAEEENVSLSPATSIESLDATGDVSQPCSLVHSDLLQGAMEEEKVMTQSSSTEQSPKSGVELALSLIKSFECRPVRVFRGSRLPVPIKPHQTPQAADCPFSLQPADLVPLSVQQELQLDLAEIEALWLDDYVPCGPLGFQEKLIAEQQVQLVQYENAAGQCVTELQKAQLQVQSLQTKIRESEANTKELQQRLGVVETELLSLRETARGQERTIQTLNDSLNTKDSEIADLHQLTEEQKQLLMTLKQQNQKHQLENLQTSTTAPGPLQAELLELQASLFSTQLELQSVQRAQRQAQRREDELTRTNQRLHDDLQEEQRHHREAEKHNQELLTALQRARSDLEQMEEKWREGEGEKEREMEDRERSIRELKARLQHKERLLHDYTELLDGQKESGGNRDVLIHKLKLRIQERDRALERAVDERFMCVEQKEAEVRKLQLLLREKERDLQKVRCVLSNNEETITSLEVLLRGKSVELEQVSEAWRVSQHVQHECEDRHNYSLRERDTLINQLQTTLHTHTNEAEEFTSALLSKVPLSSSEVVEKLNARLQVKERLFQELLKEHSHQIQEHHTHIQELLHTVHAREQCFKDAAERVGQVMQEQATRLQELRRQVVSAGSRSSSTSEPPEDVQLLQEELQLALSKQREAQREMSILRSTIAHNQKQLQSQTAQLTTLNHTSKPECPVSMETEQTASSHTDTGDSTSDVEEEEDDGASEFTESTEEEEHCRVTAQALSNTQGYEQISQTPAEVEGPGLAEVKLLVEQKQAVERELWELKAQLEKAGFTSFSQMRKALLSLRSENEELRNSVRTNEAEEETRRPSDEQRGRGVQWQPEPCESKKKRVLCLDLGAQAVQQKLPQRLLVSKSTTQTPAERLRDYRDQLMETPVKRDSKQVQVDLQDLGYETCGRSENEAERDDTSSPEFDDLELCTSLSCRDGASQWWSGLGAGSRAGGDAPSLQQKVEDLQIQLSRSQALVLSLQSRLQDATPNSTPRKPNQNDRELRELVTRVSSLEEQLRKGKGQAEKEEEEAKSTTRTGKFDTLIQAQARELSHLRQRMREGQSVCHILTQHLGDTTKSFEELLRDNDIDYYMGQSFRDQLAQSSALAHRVAAKISTRDYSEVADDRTGHELLAIRLSKELQQKDKLIESLRFQLQQQHGVAPPTSSPSLSGDADQLERASFVVDEQGSTNEDLDLCSELDTVSEFGQEDVADDSLPPAPSHPYPSNPPSVASPRSHQSSSTCPSMHCSPPRLTDGQIQTELSSAPLPQNPQCLSAQMAFPPFDPHTQHLRHRSSTTGGFSLAEVHQELQRLQRQLANSFSSAQVKPQPGVFQPPDFHLRSQHVFQQSPFASLHASPNIFYGAQHKREHAYNDVSSSSSGYQSGARHTGTDLMEEHLREIRSLHQRLEDSIQTNERLRQQLAQRLGSRIQDGGAPTNIYIQGLDSVSQLSNEVRVLKEENQALQSQLQQTSRDGMKQAEQMRDAVLFEHTRLKQAELEAEKWAGQFRQLQAQLREQTQAVLQLKQDKQMSQENANRLQHEVNVLQQQLSESRRLVHALQGELQIHLRLRGAIQNDSDEAEVQEPPSHLHMLEQQPSDRLDPEPLHCSARKRLFHGLLNPTSSVSAQLPSSLTHTGCHEGEVLAGPFACRTGRYVVGHWDDFSALQQQLLEGKELICKMEAALQTSVEINLQEGRVSSMLTNTKTLKQILEEMLSVLRMFWRAALPSAEPSQHQKEQTLTEEVVSLKHKLAEQEMTLRDTLETLRDANRTKDSMEQFIFSQLSRTRDVLKKARTNLEKNELKINSLGCSFSPPSSQSFSFTPPWATRGEISNSGHSSCPGPRLVTAPGHHPHTCLMDNTAPSTDVLQRRSLSTPHRWTHPILS
ncbi:myomegalin isoform X2 [Hemibagrus wyckioides]|uniref:myomegalin isoform X2 n=1 Tax=Hemibagrus wyckioides TaxID=337641 RepID=UPI00266B9A90|nr:myomegalin isoform X2 [Hemibagrus wyckioides]